MLRDKALRRVIAGYGKEQQRSIGPWAPKLTSGTYQAGHKLPAERFLEERDGQFALRLQRGLIQPLEQVEQFIQTTATTGQQVARHLIRQLQATLGSTQLQNRLFIGIVRCRQLENQPSAQA